MMEDHLNLNFRIQNSVIVLFIYLLIYSKFIFISLLHKMQSIFLDDGK